MADTPNGETVKPEALENNVTPPATPVVNAVDPAEVERLRKENEQAQLRINQLVNAEEARKKAEDEAKAKELETQQQFKTLAEQEKAKREELERQIADGAKKTEVKTESDKVLADYSPEVKKLAETTGLSLTDTDETTVAAFKAKLDEIKGMVGGQKVTPNNPNAPTPQGPSVFDEDGMIKTPLENSPDKLDDIFKSMPGVRSMMGPVEE